MVDVFIDGGAGTVGLGIRDRLAQHEAVNIVSLPEAERKSEAARREMMNDVDVVFLCLPDDAARDAVHWVVNPKVKVIDGSSAHRTHQQWQYGLAEMPIEIGGRATRQRERIRDAKRVSVPGCYPTGFILAYRPLVQNGFIPPDRACSIHAISGYSGGGKQLIADFEQRSHDADPSYSVRPYGLGLMHKHLPEMQQYGQLVDPPLFCPAVGHFAQGMLVQIPLHLNAFRVKLKDIHQLLSQIYAAEPLIRVLPLNPNDELEGGFLNPCRLNQTNLVELMVFGHEDQALLIARLDNLGKGASGAAVQNFNIMMGLEETMGLAVAVAQ